jgi:hypothetical protein
MNEVLFLSIDFPHVIMLFGIDTSFGFSTGSNFERGDSPIFFFTPNGSGYFIVYPIISIMW